MSESEAVAPAAGAGAAKERAALVAAYREGLGLAAVTVIDGRAGLSIVAGEDAGDPSAAPADARWWCRRHVDAERVATAATRLMQRRRAKDGAAAAPAFADAAQAIAAAATRLDVMLYADADVAFEAEGIIARLDQEIEELRRSGGMKSVNRMYKSYRIETSGRGDKVLTYAQWLSKYRQNLLRELAAVLRDR